MKLQFSFQEDKYIFLSWKLFFAKKWNLIGSCLPRTNKRNQKLSLQNVKDGSEERCKDWSNWIRLPTAKHSSNQIASRTVKDKDVSLQYWHPSKINPSIPKVVLKFRHILGRREYFIKKIKHADEL